MISIIAIGGFLLAAVMASFHILRAQTLPDRMVALDVLLMALMGAVAVRAAETGDVSYINIIVVLAVVAFTSTVAVSRFVEHRGVV